MGCNNCGCGNSSWVIILIIILLLCGGFNNDCGGCGCGCNELHYTQAEMSQKRGGCRTEVRQSP